MVSSTQRSKKVQVTGRGSRSPAPECRTDHGALSQQHCYSRGGRQSQLPWAEPPCRWNLLWTGIPGQQSPLGSLILGRFCSAAAAFFSSLMPRVKMTNRRLMPWSITTNSGGSWHLQRTFIQSFSHLFIGLSIKHSLSIHHFLESATKLTRHTEIPAYVLIDGDDKHVRR